MIGERIPNTKYNPNCICGSCAVANLLTFLSFNINQRFVPQQYQNSINFTNNRTHLYVSAKIYLSSSSSIIGLYFKIKTSSQLGHSNIEITLPLAHISHAS
ncbi:hypothetical protein [Clostridium sp. HBUAS56017]|uniref:hypothetical protein n=1 Tax=Clostridium sp. HBUAS56017 TaxID=2571128 RepID=UPI001A9B9C66|nr:hypothetical protein [Clostridium sp. HBUAS56017]